jgi:outer membrane lipoprotein-sorting protein
MLMRLIPLILAALVALAGPAAAAVVARPAPLTQQDKADLARIEQYFDGIHTMQSKFLQFSDNGGMAAGRVFLSRPGKMRFEYDPPTKLLLVANSGILAYYDLMLQQESNVPLSATPLSILLSDKVSLMGPVTVTKFERSADTIRVTLQQTKDPSQGALTLVFSDKPLQLKQWAVLDAQNITTKVTLIDPQFGPRLDAKLFNFINPREQGGPGSGN